MGRGGAWTEVFAQIGPSRLRPRHIQHAEFVSPKECSERMTGADAVVAHAGIGTILTALELGKPLLVMPRRAEFGEHRNDHQLATAVGLPSRERAPVAFDETELAVGSTNSIRSRRGRGSAPQLPKPSSLPYVPSSSASRPPRPTAAPQPVA